MRLCCRCDGVRFLFLRDGSSGGSSGNRSGGSGDGGLRGRFGGELAMFHEFVLPIPTNSIFDPVNIVGDYKTST